MADELLVISAFVALLLLFGCTLPQLPWEQPKPSAPPPLPPGSEIVAPQPSGPSGAYDSASTPAPEEYVISYNASVTEMGRVRKMFQATFYKKGEFRGRTDILTQNDEFVDEIRRYYTGGGKFLCIRQKGKALKCSTAELVEETESYSQEIISPVKNSSIYDVKLQANQSVLGINATCFGLNSSEGTYLLHCFSPEGILYYGKEKTADGRAREMKATAYRKSASDSDFELPVKFQQEAVDTFEGVVPRNISDRISDGQFRLADQGAFPLKIYVISSGFSDSILVTKGEFGMLVDAGNFLPVDSFLKHLGIKKLNVLVATRDYSGAVDGIPDLLENYEVGELWENNVAPSSQSLKSSLEKARQLNMTIKHPQEGDRMNFSDVTFTVINPSENRQLGNPDIDAIVMKVSMGKFCALILNPTVQERENALISTGEDLKCEVLTYFKHGEGRPEPSVLMSNVAPKDVIISVGQNSLGLPRSTTLTRLNISGTHIWRTDERGTVRITNDGFSPYQIAGMANFTTKRWTDYYGMNAS
ncbi:TPA: hypothetical protein HA225_02925 [Candidatus Micrarchaeota archaeon]|nr:hypothetical protein [Candidatus Micrarchaeota archaeon]